MLFAQEHVPNSIQHLTKWNNPCGDATAHPMWRRHYGLVWMTLSRRMHRMQILKLRKWGPLNLTHTHTLANKHFSDSLPVPSSTSLLPLPTCSKAAGCATHMCLHFTWIYIYSIQKREIPHAVMPLDARTIVLKVAYCTKPYAHSHGHKLCVLVRMQVRECCHVHMYIVCMCNCIGRITNAC